MINFDGRVFRGVLNYENGDFDNSVVFAYRQTGSVVFAAFRGNRIPHGVILARLDHGSSVAGHWMYIDSALEPHIGVYTAAPIVLDDGRVRLRERWATMSPGPPAVGESEVEEVVNVADCAIDDLFGDSHGERQT